MEGEIVNRVANSKLKVIDLEELYPQGNRISLDISQWLFEGLILKEKDFREKIAVNNWEAYRGAYVALKCSTDAIIPSWAYLLLTTKLQPFAKKIVTGSLEMLETVIFNDIINNLSIDEFKNAPVIVKGCSNKPVPASAYNFLIQKLQPEVKSIMFGEACSSVPLFKR